MRQPSASDAPPESSRHRPLLEVLTVYGLVCALTWLFKYSPSVLPGMAPYSELAVELAFLAFAVGLARRHPNGMQHYGIDLAGVLSPASEDDPRPAGPFGLYDLARALRKAALPALRELGVALAVCAVIFPLFVVGFVFYREPIGAFRWVPRSDWTSYLATQLLVVAFCEEALFRGFVHTRLHDYWTARRSLLGVKLNLKALVLTSVLFALVHFVALPHPARLAVFFPSLLFGWLRAWRGGIGAAVLVHALSNVLSDVLNRGWLFPS